MSGSESPQRSRGARRGTALTLVFASVLATAAATNSLPHAEEEASADRARSVTSTADRDEVAQAAADAMANGTSATEAAEEVVSRSGDRWGAVYDKREYEEFQQALDGEYTGVGLWARRTTDGVLVTRVQPGGPAQRAGIGAGDVIRAIDGVSVAKRPVTEVMALLRGDAQHSADGDGDGDGDTSDTGDTKNDDPESAGVEEPGASAVGTTVVLDLERDGQRRTQSLRRATLTTQSVMVDKIEGGALRIKVGAFTKGTGKRVRNAVLAAPKGAGVLLDLRGNGGGLVTEAVEATSAFLDGGLVATYDIRGEQRALYADPGGDTDRPVVVVVDGGTMSAAELVTGALQDRGRSVTVGSRTFGKGAVQMPSTLPDGSVAELTVGHYRTPAGHGVDGRGVTPDLQVSEGAQERARTVLSGLGSTE